MQDFKWQNNVLRKKNKKLKQIVTQSHFRKLNGDQLKKIIDEIFAKRLKSCENFNSRQIEYFQEEDPSARSDFSDSSTSLLEKQLKDKSKGFLYRLFSR